MQAIAQPTPQPTPQPTTSPTVSPAKTPKTCNVGACLISLHDFDLANGLFSKDFWLWRTCPSYQFPRSATGIDITGLSGGEMKPQRMAIAHLRDRMNLGTQSPFAASNNFVRWWSQFRAYSLSASWAIRAQTYAPTPHCLTISAVRVCTKKQVTKPFR